MLMMPAFPGSREERNRQTGLSLETQVYHLERICVVLVCPTILSKILNSITCEIGFVE